VEQTTGSAIDIGRQANHAWTDISLDTLAQPMSTYGTVSLGADFGYVCPEHPVELDAIVSPCDLLPGHFPSDLEIPGRTRVVPAEGLAVARALRVCAG